VIAATVAVVLPSTGLIGAALVGHGIAEDQARASRIAIEAGSLVTGALAVVLALSRVAAGFSTSFLVLVIIGVGALATAIIVVNNLRDRAGDARAGKRTLAVRFGRRFAIVEYVALLLLAFVVPAGLALAGHRWAALPLLTAPLAIHRVRALAVSEGVALNPCLAATAQLLLAHGALFALGLGLG